MLLVLLLVLGVKGSRIAQLASIPLEDANGFKDFKEVDLKIEPLDVLGAPQFSASQCLLRNGHLGDCKSLQECPSALANIRQGISPVTCPLQRKFCCEKETSPFMSGIMVPAPSMNFECGRRESIGIRFARSTRNIPEFNFKGPPDREVAVVGGEISRENSWPWMALLGVRTGSKTEFFCSAILINSQWVLTAAHCLNRDNFIVRLGEHNQNLNSKKVLDLDVTEIVPYPEYNLRTKYHDIALLKLERPVPVNLEIRPVCLPWGPHTNKSFIGHKATVTGWGAENYGGIGSSVLREVQVFVFDPSVCVKGYSTLLEYTSSWPSGLTTDNMVCAGDLAGNKDACQGDSGGPLVIETFGRYTLVGIVSKGHGCGDGNFPGLYTPVSQSKYLQWIKDVAFG